MDDSNRRSLLKLWLAHGIGPERRLSLLERFGSANAVFQARFEEIKAVPGMTHAAAERLLDPNLDQQAESEWNRMQSLGISWLSVDDADYPSRLKEIPRPATALTLKGTLVENEPIIAIVGSRKCTPYGRQFAARLSADLARAGITIVSGLARGIDAVAHESALEAGGRTLAVLASGLNNIYPPEHKGLADRIVHHGALLSEAPLDGPPIGNLFPLRNRIISGLSLGVIVVEATSQSGAMSTAYHALDQNREVFAVPGRLDDPNSEGALDLIRRGAGLVRSAADILEHIAPILGASQPNLGKPLRASARQTPPPPAEPIQSVTMPSNLNDDESKIWMSLGVDGLDADTLAERTGISTSKLAGMLLMLEMRRVVQRRPGNRFVRG